MKLKTLHLIIKSRGLYRSGNGAVVPTLIRAIRVVVKRNKLKIKVASNNLLGGSGD
jgi:hypothetical protein